VAGAGADLQGRAPRARVAEDLGRDVRGLAGWTFPLSAAKRERLDKPSLPADVVIALRDALTRVDFTVDRVAELLGRDAHAALERNETTPARRRTADGSALATLVRVWTLQASVAAPSLEAALPGLVDPMVDRGLLERAGDEVRALVDIRPYADDDRSWWVVSDLTPGLDGRERRMRADHVLGVSSASTSLAQLTIREPIGRALDLGTGSGVQALHLSRHALDVVATDLSERCIALARLTTGLNDVTVDLRTGDLFAPVEDETFDLVVSNPPFVISAATDERLFYRDSGLPGDELVRRVLVEGAARLTDGGWCQILANWAHVGEQPWEERVGDWLRQTGCDVWVVQREQIDVTRYAEMWLDDAGLRGSTDYLARYDRWLCWFDEQGIESIGFGWINLRKAGHTEPVLRLEEWPYDVEQPIGPHVAGWGWQVDAATAYDRDDAWLGQRLVRAADVVEERTGLPGDVDQQHIVVRQQRGLRRAREMSTVEAAFYGACDGELTVGQIADALAMLLEADIDATRREVVTAARDLLTTGFFR
jgi:hypothetical protein